MEDAKTSAVPTPAVPTPAAQAETAPVKEEKKTPTNRLTHYAMARLIVWLRKIVEADSYRGIHIAELAKQAAIYFATTKHPFLVTPGNIQGAAEAIREEAEQTEDEKTLALLRKRVAVDKKSYAEAVKMLSSITQAEAKAFASILLNLHSTKPTTTNQ